MTDFERAFLRQTEGLDALSPGVYPHEDDGSCECSDCTDRDPESDEGSFSWSPCETCGSTLGGNRYAAHYLDADHDVNHLEVCTDCLCFMANGDVPEEWNAE